MTLVFIDRPPTENELEKLRLILSTFQDGTGMLNNGQLPGWRDFERACAIVFHGTAVESKFFVDVIFPLDKAQNTFYGIDCKMRRELDRAIKKAEIYVEVTNAANFLWSYLSRFGVDKSNFADKPDLAGPALIEAIETLKKSGASSYDRGVIRTDVSYYFILQWNTQGNYKLYQLPLTLEQNSTIKWECHVQTRADGSTTRRLVGREEDTMLYEWFGDSGGQFKYYPSTESALWASKIFRLEPLNESIELGLIAKAQAYFPDKWAGL